MPNDAPPPPPEETRTAMDAAAVNTTPGSAEVPTPPGARWRDEGKPDPHGTRYDCERAQTLIGHFKDRIRWLSRALQREEDHVRTLHADNARLHDEIVTLRTELAAALRAASR